MKRNRKKGDRPRFSAKNGVCPLFFLLAFGSASALDYRGHVKGQGIVANLPGDSLLRDFSDDPARDYNLDGRLNLAGTTGAWTWQADYQVLLRTGDFLSLRQQDPAPGLVSAALPDDGSRVFDLSHIISERDDKVFAHRLDRLYLGHSSDKTVFKIGRQAVSWGNGLIYNPVDFFNPFDPAAIDKEYKTGDDMLYAQYLFGSGDDLQAVWVGRRDQDHDVSASVSSLALKYHRFSAAAEFDLLVAEHFDAGLVALGATADAAGAIWRGDILRADSGDDSFSSAVLNWSYSWLAWNKNISATVEYFRNGYGIGDGDYGPPALDANPELLQRIERGELFTLGKNYLSAVATIELTPLWWLTVSIFNNLDDHSTLVQLFSQHDLQQDLQLYIALNLPTGSDGSEYGGIDSAVADRSLGTGASVFTQLAWYF